MDMHDQSHCEGITKRQVLLHRIVYSRVSLNLFQQIEYETAALVFQQIPVENKARESDEKANGNAIDSDIDDLSLEKTVRAINTSISVSVVQSSFSDTGGLSRT